MLARYIPTQRVPGRLTKYSCEVAAIDLLDATPYIPVRSFHNIHFTIQKATVYPHLPNTEIWSPASPALPSSQISTLPAPVSVIPSNTNHGCRVDLEFAYGGKESAPILLYTSHGENVSDAIIPPDGGYVRLVLSDTNTTIQRTSNQQSDAVLLRLITRAK